MKLFHTQGFILGHKLKGWDSPNQYDGYRLDELTLISTMTSKKDVENVISYLQIHKHCFDPNSEGNKKSHEE